MLKLNPKYNLALILKKNKITKPFLKPNPNLINLTLNYANIIITLNFKYSKINLIKRCTIISELIEIEKILTLI